MTLTDLRTLKLPDERGEVGYRVTTERVRRVRDIGWLNDQVFTCIIVINILRIPPPYIVSPLHRDTQIQVL